MSDIVDFIAQGDTDLRPALERAVAEIVRLKAALREAQAFLAAQPDGPRNDVLAVVRAALEGK